MRKQDVSVFARGVRDQIVRDMVARYVFVDDQYRFRACAEDSKMLPRMASAHTLVGYYDEKASYDDILSDAEYTMQLVRAKDRSGRVARGARA